jgi:hypothetical protein
MQHNIETKITINAPADKIWAVLMEFENHPKWNPLIKSISGDPKVGSHIFLQIQNMKFTPIVLANTPNREFRWKGKLFSDYIFTGEHYFILNHIAENETELIHGEIFEGILLLLMKNSLNTNTLNGFKEMNEALKKQVEVS